MFRVHLKNETNEELKKDFVKPTSIRNLLTGNSDDEFVASLQKVKQHGKRNKGNREALT